MALSFAFMAQTKKGLTYRDKPFPRIEANILELSRRRLGILEHQDWHHSIALESLAWWWLPHERGLLVILLRCPKQLHRQRNQDRYLRMLSLLLLFLVE
jgi:hypothetical protein